MAAAIIRMARLLMLWAGHPRSDNSIDCCSAHLMSALHYSKCLSRPFRTIDTIADLHIQTFIQHDMIGIGNNPSNHWVGA